MKKLSCDLCDQAFEAETFEEWFQQMMGHYKSVHADFMAAAASKSKEEGAQWMADNRTRFDAA